jgi:heme/copper-type cytochrome/quinol oxidase subunit 2
VNAKLEIFTKYGLIVKFLHVELSGIKMSNMLLGTGANDLHKVAFYLCCTIAVIVFMILMYSVIKRRCSRNTLVTHFHQSVCLELGWTLFSFAILIALAFPATLHLFTAT